MAKKPTQTAYSKPPKHSDSETHLRRQKIAAALMACYKVCGWRQPVGDEWRLEVIAWSSALAFIPTEDLNMAFDDALAQPWAPKPLTPDYVKDVYNGLPGQGVELVGDASHVLYRPTAPPPLPALPAPDGVTSITYEQYAEGKAAEIAAKVEDPELAGVLQRLMSVALLPKELRPKEEAPSELGQPRRFEKTASPTSGKQYIENILAGDLPAFIREGINASKEIYKEGLNHADDPEEIPAY